MALAARQNHTSIEAPGGDRWKTAGKIQSIEDQPSDPVEADESSQRIKGLEKQLAKIEELCKEWPEEARWTTDKAQLQAELDSARKQKLLSMDPAARTAAAT